VLLDCNDVPAALVVSLHAAHNTLTTMHTQPLQEYAASELLGLGDSHYAYLPEWHAQ
jgi:hypothetical protein